MQRNSVLFQIYQTIEVLDASARWYMRKCLSEIIHSVTKQMELWQSNLFLTWNGVASPTEYTVLKGQPSIQTPILVESIEYHQSCSMWNPCGIHGLHEDPSRLGESCREIHKESTDSIGNPWNPWEFLFSHPKGSSWIPWNPCGIRMESAEWMESTRNRWGSVNCCSI
jgi:hypothetical protein